MQFPDLMWAHLMPFLALQDYLCMRYLNKNIQHVLDKHCFTMTWSSYGPLSEFLSKCTNMTSLVVNNYIKDMGYILHKDNVGHLPPNLLSLVIPEGCNLDTHDAIALLPRHLTHLDVGHARLWSNKALANLPRHLTYLKCRIIPDRKKTLNLKYLPSTLKTLLLHENCSYKSENGLSKEFFEQLPRALTRFSFLTDHKITSEQLKHLPGQLEWLEIDNKYAFPLHACLPHTLRHLKILNSDHITDEQLSHLPPLLTYLNLNRVRSITYQGIRQLPSTLISLELIHFDVSEQYIHLLPRNLTHLKLCPDQKLTSACLMHLPRTLISLDINYFEWIHVDDLKQLPPHLQELELVMDKLDLDIWMQSLPKSLTNLHIPHLNIKLSTMHHLPSRLVELTIESKNVTEAHIALLPPTLKFLVVSWAESWTDHALSLLPRELIEFELHDGLTTFTSDAIANLPRNLRSLHFGCANKLTLACLKHLPRTLTHLQMEIHIASILEKFNAEDVPPYVNYKLTPRRLIFALPPYRRYK